MPTMKDIARLAGVSYGTVSNVINHRGNVSTDKIRLVEEASRKLGYSINVQAQKLRKDKNRQAVFILPDIEQQGLRVFYTTLKAMLEESRYETVLYLSNNSLETEKSLVKVAMGSRPEYIICFCSGDSGELYSALDTKIIFINHPYLIPLKNQMSFSFNFETAALDFAERIKMRGNRSVALFFDSAEVPANSFFYRSLYEKLNTQGIELEPFYYNPKQAYHGAVAVLERLPAFDLIISNNLFYIDKIKQVRELLNVNLPEILCFGISGIIPPFFCPQYEFDYREMASSVSRAVLDCESYLGRSSSLKPKGFTKLIKNTQVPVANVIKILTITCPTASILSMLVPYFKRATGITVEVTILTYEELFSLIFKREAVGFDLIRVDLTLNARLKRELFMPLIRFERQIGLLQDSFLDTITTAYCSNMEDLYTLPFDPSIQMLFYRQDLFENSTIKRMYYESTRKQLRLPLDFDEYNRTAVFFTRKNNSASPTKFGSTMTFGTAASGAAELLPRIMNKSDGSFRTENEIDLTGPWVREALEEYIALKDYSAPKINYWWDESLKLFTSGMSAMTVIFINHASRIIHSVDGGSSIKVGAAPVPGGFPLLGGGCIGISRQSKNAEGCIAFLQWLYNDEIAGIITLLGGLSPCKSAFRNEEILEIYPWFRNIDEHFKSGWRGMRTGYPQFDDHQFESILGSAIHSAALGLVPVEEALANAQRQCESEFSILREYTAKRSPL
jgi:multiple sugar transport system substrate-binding protein